MKAVIASLLLAQSLSAALAIQCYHCSYNTFDSSNPFLSTVLGTLEKLSNDHCQLLNKNDGYELDIRNCPPAKPGHVYKCGVIKGTVNADFSVFEVEYNTIERDCVEVPDDEAAYDDGCHDDLPASGPVRGLVEETFAGANLGDVTFSGEACYDSDTIQVSGPVCPRCTYGRLETDNDVIQFFLDAIRVISDDSCLFQDADDVYDVTYRNCPPGGYDETSKCGDIDGRISGRLLSVNFELTTLQRDCVVVPKNGDKYSDGCHDDVSDSPVIAPLIQESYGGDSAVTYSKFEGQACFQPYFAPLVDSGANTPRGVFAVVIATLMMLLTIYVL